MRLGIWGFIVDQWRTQQPVVKADLTGKTILVLGANTGLGFEATKHFATMNPGRLILACRNQSKGQAAVDKLKADTGYSKAELWIVDLADFESVKQFGDKFERDGGRLDILVENAAIAVDKYEASKDGWETSLQVNCLSTPLVALLLLPAMLKTAKEHSTVPRLVVVSSDVHYWVDIEKRVYENPDIIKTLGSTEYCTDKIMKSRYLLTKLLNVFFVRGLNAHLPPSTPLIVNTVNPGYCYSELRRGFKGLMAVVDRLMELALAFTTEVGSRRLVWAAVGLPDQPEKLRGQYISACQVQEPSDFVLGAQGVKLQDHLWDELVSILGKVDPRVTANVAQYLSPVAA
ncbi:hypothetical protein B0H19DRAFT_1251172 [Mycena capillaripes]|nr:hypothetical protein B0H19DRAFT_1251172 [Mycena capillaripes]